MKNAVVTGASTGIGRAVAIELAKNNFFIFLVGRNQKGLQETALQIDELHGKSKIMDCDLTSIESINTLLDKLKKEALSLDLIANIAGIWHGVDEVYAGKDYETFDQTVVADTIQVGIVAPMMLVHGLLSLMKAGSTIINLSGTFENGAKGWLPYYVSKRAIEDFTVGLSQELLDKDIRVNCISPSDTATEQYVKYFPEFIPDAIQPIEIGQKFVELATGKFTQTGKIIIMKKDELPFEHFHY